ncbi:DUF2029 domain-containing protein [Paraburkholderia sp. Ac-20340]|uniref:glycosyltransferase family 87 protein n=1 Tax=Paraburkholderia sp. Ac-20340 TaxID=2703888 RepID=UPI0019800FAD|nr:glycosyltransferase family 87 protein [Paraburkholderia sp. Ac-20340]MBN3854984.1 DUF2029 domain-containing protein [Paraburkholderia sp. Ac-20340]
MNAHLAAARRAPMRAGHWLNPARLRNWSFVALMCYLIVGLGYLYHLASHHAGFRQPATDMLPFWSASFLALKGHAIDAYNMQAIKAIELAISPAPVEAGGYVLPWLYPPTALLAVLPLALLPYPAAVVLFVLGSCALFAVTVRAIVRHAEAGWMALAFPGAALVVVMGQNALLTAALAGLGLHWLRRHPVASGICFGLLFMKPHLAPLFPFALLCSRSWRALASTCLTVAATLVLALLAFGANTFDAFVHATTFATGYVEAGKGCLERIPTFFALMRMLQAPVPLAYAVQGISILAACWAVFETWRREAPLALRAATLMCASLLVSPYLHDYDLAWYGVVIAWCCRYGFSHGWRRGEREWLCLLWLAPVLGMLVVARVHVQFLPIISAMTLWMLVQRTREAQRAPVVLAGNRDD